MKNIFRLESISDYNDMAGIKTLHPLVSVIDFSKVEKPFPKKLKKIYHGLYAISLKEVECGDIIYGQSKYDYKEGSLVFYAPGQIVGFNQNESQVNNTGFLLLFHSDLIYGTSLGKKIENYSFFSYQTNEALHLSDYEKGSVLDCFKQIIYEIEQRVDKYTNKFIVNSIQTLLDYSMRFYDRQFIIRERTNTGILEKFELFLQDYYRYNNQVVNGLPSVTSIALELNLSTNYLGDLIKKMTGKTALEYIHLKVINLAKDKILDTSKSLSEIAYELGFQYPQHFTRLFKQKVGITPKEYRFLN